MDHLRVCGADDSHTRPGMTRPGSPPRVRSRPTPESADMTDDGITSACAEQTRLPHRPGMAPGDHLRVCGADPGGRPLFDPYEGSPPRVRSRHVPPDSISAAIRITSACAEQTILLVSCRRVVRDHLRVCGADFYRFFIVRRVVGSPPRVRSRQHV